MENPRKPYLWAFAALCLLAPDLTAAGAALQIGWTDLRPGADAGADAAPPPDVRGRTVELAGYLLPVDREGDLVYGFMLVPWVGACSHTPPPPSNQVVLVTPVEPYRLNGFYEPVTVSGVIEAEAEKSQLFLVDGVAVVESGYSIGKARVAKTGDAPEAEPRGGATPWKFLK